MNSSKIFKKLKLAQEVYDKNFLNEEERIYAGAMIYYNISDLIITKEIAQKFVPIKQKEQEKVIEKSKDKRIEKGD